MVHIFEKYVIIKKTYHQVESPDLSVRATGAQVFRQLHFYYYLNLSTSTQKYLVSTLAHLRIKYASLNLGIYPIKH